MGLIKQESNVVNKKTNKVKNQIYIKLTVKRAETDSKLTVKS